GAGPADAGRRKLLRGDDPVPPGPGEGSQERGGRCRREDGRGGDQAEGARARGGPQARGAEEVRGGRGAAAQRGPDPPARARGRGRTGAPAARGRPTQDRAQEEEGAGGGEQGRGGSAPDGEVPQEPAGRQDRRVGKGDQSHADD